MKNKTVAIKLNLTGQPQKFPVDPLFPYRTEPKTVLATAHLIAKAGARRIRIIETFFPARQEMELWARYQLDIDAINNVGCKVEWENAQNLGLGKQYARIKVPGNPYMFPAYDLNHSFVDCDVYVSMSKLKNHWLAGVTMSLKNNFGITPCSLYGGDCGPSGNEDPKQERGQCATTARFRRRRECPRSCIRIRRAILAIAFRASSPTWFACGPSISLSWTVWSRSAAGKAPGIRVCRSLNPA